MQLNFNTCYPMVKGANGEASTVRIGRAQEDTLSLIHIYPERKVAAFYSKRDLEKLFNLRSMRTSLKYVQVDKSIAGRYYQEGAVKAVCQAFGEKNRRKALLVMATGSGKTRTVIALVDVYKRQL